MKRDLSDLLKGVRIASENVQKALNKALKSDNGAIDDTLIKEVLEAQKEWKKAADLYSEAKDDSREDVIS